MRIVVDALCLSIPAFFNVFAISMIFWLIFALMGYGFFGGLFYKCVDADGERVDYDVVGNRTACCGSSNCTESAPGIDGDVFRWENSEVNFDNVFNAYLALFQVATFEGWQEVMQDAVDITGRNRQPQREHQFYAYWYFFIFIVIGSFLTLNLFIGVIIDNFTRLKGQMGNDGSESHLFLTDEQLVRIRSIKKVLRSRPMKSVPLPPDGVLYEFRHLCYKLSQSIKFELFIMVVIVANLVLLCTDHYGENEQEEKIQLIFNVIFSCTFVLEATIKLLGLRRYYFQSYWNNFDLIITILGAIDVVLTLGTDESPPVDPTFLRILRLARLVRLLKHAKGIRDLLITMIVSLPALFNVGVLLFMIIFVYAIIGMVLFRYVIYNGALNPIVNFETFGRSLQLMFRLCTAAGWNDITDALSVQPPYCNATYDGLPNGNCGDPVAAKWFMSTYVGIAFLIIVNMYIAVILESLEETTDEDEHAIDPQDIEVFYQHWQRFDPTATQFIDVTRIPNFFRTIPSPFDKLFLYSKDLDILDTLDIPLYCNRDVDDLNGIPHADTTSLEVNSAAPIEFTATKAHCLDVIIATFKSKGSLFTDTELDAKAHGHGSATGDTWMEHLGEVLSERFPVRRSLQPVSSTKQWYKLCKAVNTVQTVWKRRTTGDFRPAAPANLEDVF
eukprot:m.1142368 g.1142368  ORF g.1142368 m.1142368 type:complete len:670 (-) comp24454_c0_seq3:1121-3130(-)